VERRRLPGDIQALVAPALERRGILAAFPERNGGVSRGPFASLNLGAHTGDRDEDVRRNRSLAALGLGIRRFASARQVHGATIATVATPDDHVGEADAIATTEAGVPVAVTVADCVPVALGSEHEPLLIAVHVGWRGLAAGLLGAAALRFAEPARAAAAIGPAIGPCHYEVGREVIEAVEHGSGVPPVVERRGTRTFLDLPATAESVLRSVGFREVDRAEECTACHEERFFSHRRDGRTGRHALVAMRM
jgi:YfiH family protein